MRLLFGILGVLIVALVGLSVRAWQLFGEPEASPPPSPSVGSELPSARASERPAEEPASASPVATSGPAPQIPPTRASSAPPSGFGVAPPPTSRTSLRGIVIALDPGHNGANSAHPAQIGRLVDAGGFDKECNTTGTATDDGFSEAAFNWQVARRLSALLTASGADVRMTRSNNSGWGPCIDARGRFGSSVGAKVALSLHADGAPAHERGFHVIAPALKPGYTDDILPASQRLAVTVRDSLVSAGFATSTYLGTRGLDTRSDLGTLNMADVPTAMVECGNLRAPGDAALLRSATGQARLATGLATALTRYLTTAS